MQNICEHVSSTLFQFNSTDIQYARVLEKEVTKKIELPLEL